MAAEAILSTYVNLPTVDICICGINPTLSGAAIRVMGTGKSQCLHFSAGDPDSIRFTWTLEQAKVHILYLLLLRYVN